MKLYILLVFLFLLVDKLSFSSPHKHKHNHNESIKLSDLGMRLSGIKVSTAKSQKLSKNILVVGEVSLNKDQVAHINSRYFGVIKSIAVKLGQNVKSGEELAVIQANGTEQNFSLKSRLKGVVLKKSIVTGQFVDTDHVNFVVANLDAVWIYLKISEKYVSLVKLGQKITLQGTGDDKFFSKIDYISPLMHEDSQSIIIRCSLDNKQRKWRPGQFVHALISLTTHNVALAIKRSSIQKIGNRSVVFKHTKRNTFDAQVLTLGLSTHEWVEVKAGLNEGDEYASSGSFILKADLMKSEAEHHH